MRFWSSLFLIVVFLMNINAHASPDSFVYQGRIVKPDGTALEYNNVSFAFAFTNAAGNCVFYREQKDNVDMQGSGGMFDVPIGSGTRLFPTGPTADIRDAFKNSVSLPCEGGGNYTPSETEVRLLKVQFHDGVGWNAITPYSTIRSVPFSTFSYSAGRLGNNVAGDFVLKSSIATCSVGQYLTFDGTNFACQNDSGGTGTVSDVNVSSPLTKGGTPAIPTIGINVGTTAGTVAAGNDIRFGNATKIQGTAVDATAPTLAQVLRYDGSSSWVPSTLAISDISGLSTQLANKINATMFPTSCTAGQSLVFVSPANKFDCYDISITASQISGTIPFSKLASLPTTLSGYGITDAVKNNGGTPGFKSGTNATKGAAGTAGNIYISTDTKEIYRDNGTTWDLIGSATGTGGTITGVTAGTGLTGGGTTGAVTLNVNVGTGASQIVQLDTSSKLPAVDGSALTNLNPSALSAVVPLTKGGTGQTTALASFNALSPLTAKGDIHTRDSTNNIRLAVGTDGQVLSADSAQTSGLKWITPNAGTVTSVTASSPLAVATGTTTPAISISAGTGSAQVLRWNTSAWAASYFNFADLKSAAGTQQIPNNCTSTQTLVWQSGSDTFACVTISVTGANFGSQSANLVFAGPTSGSAAPTFRSLASSDLPATGATGVFLNGGNSFGTGATVGTNDANNFSLKAGGSSAATITPAGLFGIGITPTYNFHIQKNQNSITEGRIENLIASGNTSAGARFQVVGNDVSGMLAAYPGDYSVAAYQDRFIVAANSTASNGLLLTTNTTSPIDLAANGATTPALRVTSTNQIAIGQTSVTGRLSTTPTNYGDLAVGMTYNSLNWYQPDATGWAGSFASAGEQGLVVATDTTTGTVFQASSGAYNVGTARRANPLLTVKGTGFVGINTSTPVSALNIVADNKSADTYDDLNIHTYHATYTPGIILTRGRGTEASPTPLLINDLLGSYNFRGWSTSTTVGSGASIQAVAEDNWASGDTPTNMRFLTNSGASIAERMRIAANGYVGIGTTTPTSTLDVNGSIIANNGANIAMKASTATVYDSGDIVWFNSDNTEKARINAGTGSAGILYFSVGTPTSTKMTIQNDGNVGIGTVTPSYKLHVIGTAGLSTGTAWTNASDARLKDIHGDYEYGLNEVLQLHTVRYSYKKDNPLKLPSDYQKTGFIAQEVQKVIPDAVTKRSDGYLELNVDPIHWAVVNAVKDLYHRWFDDSQIIHEKISEQDRKIASIESENQILKEENKKLQKEHQDIKYWICKHDPDHTMCH
ncbi:hypothetical protein DOM22_02980 [Bdellovibrio sp. ZAP7]|uniref:tail fiber domain-containing protein n=1 Tax=Bdellovibrio sp. ZAP7 TaxID=2231053 RepID=UPI00115A5D8D|nr:tail fiber domain-containing protein [Bdellovibrio sp. ZAP7]QDK44187.1 hypothetical protein DOM22_02980 [Bdellovibrio sp. ZAP7]